MDIDSIKIKKFCDLTGETEAAVRHLINDGVWLDGREYTRMPNGRLWISIKGFENWINKNRKKIPAAFKNR